MAKYSKFNIVYLLQKWMDSVAGQTFMNYAYSWGAAVVILGTLFKLTHLPGANMMLFIGMGTEVFVFFISAFDRPFDKTADGRDLATDSEIAAAAALANSMVNGGNAGVDNVGSIAVDGENNAQQSSEGNTTIVGNGGNATGGTIVIGGGYAPSATSGNANVAAAVSSVDANGGTVIMGQSVVPETAGTAGSLSGITAPQGTSGNEMPGLSIGAPAPAVTPETAQAMEEATTTYVDRLNELNELLLKVGAQSERLTTDSEEMENLNRTLTGIARVYEMQLKSASQQITTQDEINEQTRIMAKQIQELNAIYARMIDAMTLNAAANSVVR